MKLHKHAGVAAVELALIMVPMLVLCLGITEVGRALYQYDGVVKATRGAARYLTRQNLNTDEAYDAAVATAKALAVCGKQTCSSCDAKSCADPRLVVGLNDASQVTVTRYSSVPTGAGSASLITVTIGGVGDKAVRFTSMFPVASWGLDSITFAPVSVSMVYSTT